jgi:hypothetical protein
MSKVISVRIEPLPAGSQATAHLHVQGESAEAELAFRPFRPIEDWTRLVRDALIGQGFAPAALHYSATLGCLCGCGAGWTLVGLTGMRFLLELDSEGDVQVTDPQGALARWNQLESTS